MEKGTKAKDGDIEADVLSLMGEIRKATGYRPNRVFGFLDETIAEGNCVLDALAAGELPDGCCGSSGAADGGGDGDGEDDSDFYDEVEGKGDGDGKGN